MREGPWCVNSARPALSYRGSCGSGGTLDGYEAMKLFCFGYVYERAVVRCALLLYPVYFYLSGAETLLDDMLFVFLFLVNVSPGL